MVRQRPRKSIEELYASKFETTTPKSAVNSSSNNNNLIMKQTARGERDLGGYLITSNTPYSAAAAAAAAASNGMQTSRRKSARPQACKSDKYAAKDEKTHLHLDDVKKDSNLKPKTARNEKWPYAAANDNNNMYDNKSYVNFSDNLHKDGQHAHAHPHPHPHHHHHPNHDDDKDDDTEEFFELIRQTVENAIGKSISDLLNRNFRELSAKIDRFSAELKSTNAHLNKLQADINNKVIHYGEENSRHFRYLCMKSEYDKMFYQHHTMLASTGDKNVAAPKPGPSGTPTPTPTPADGDKSINVCSCTASAVRSKAVPGETHKTSSEDHSLSQKSSEMGMREVLEHIQRFCTQIQLSDLKSDDRMAAKGGGYRLEDSLKINKQAFDEDDDDFQMSSDGMTPRSDERARHKYGGNTMRTCGTTHGGNGGGDA